MSNESLNAPSSPLLSPGQSDSDSEEETTSIYVPSDIEDDERQALRGSSSQQQSASSPPVSTPIANNDPTTASDIEPSPVTSCGHITHSKKRKYNCINRIRAAPKQKITKKKWLAALDSMTLTKLRSTKCCQKHCFRHVAYDHFMERSRFILTASTSTRQVILKSLRVSDERFQFDGRTVCVKFLKNSFRFSTALISAVRRNGSRDTSPSRSVSSRSCTTVSSKRSQNVPAFTDVMPGCVIQKKKEAVISFMFRIADDCGDCMPNRTETHLPFHQHQELYPIFCIEFKKLYPTQEVVSYDYFRKVWRTECPHVKVMRSHRFTICDTCDQLKAAFKERILSGHSTADLKQQRSEHTAFITKERIAYQLKKDRARLHPSECCSIIIDGADESAFGLPHFTTTPKSQRGHALKVKLVGLLHHKIDNKLYLYTMTQEHQTGANHIIETLHRFLNSKRAEGPLPPKLYIQLDNCSRENKNRYFMSYCEMLVASLVFDSVEIGFLPVGHTHEDVDQAFSQTSARLRVHNAITLSDMHDELRETYKQNVNIEHLRRIVNWSGLCEQENCVRKVDKLTQWRYFLFTPSSNVPAATNASCSSVSHRTVSCSVKQNCDDNWQPIRNSGANSSSSTSPGFLRHFPDIANTPPLNIDCPDGLKEVTKRLESEDGRVDIDKMISLHNLRDFVFRKRVDNFHWTLSSCVETEFQRRINHNNEDGESELDEDDEIMPVTMTKPTSTSKNTSTRGAAQNRSLPLTESAQSTLDPSTAGADNQAHASLASGTESEPTTKVTYDIGTFVIVRTPKSKASTRVNFWMGKVVEVIKESNSNYASKIKVLWYDKEKGTDNSTPLANVKFGPCYRCPTPQKKNTASTSRITKKQKAVQWFDIIDTDSVKVSFESLTKKRTIPLNVQKKISS